MRIAIAQFAPIVGDVHGNVERAIGIAREAESLGVEFLVFPYGYLTGPILDGLSDSMEFFDDLMMGVRKYTEQTSIHTILPGATLFSGSQRSSEIFAMKEGDMVPLRIGGMVRAFAMGEEGFDPSDFVPVIEEREARIAILSGDGPGPAIDFSDVNMVVDLSQDYYLHNVDGSRFTSETLRYRESAFAEEAGAWVLAVNGIGAHDGIVYSGGSFIMAPWGEIVAEAGEFVEELLVFDLDLNAEGSVIQERRPEQTGEMEALYEALVLATRSYVQDNGASDVVIGLSGGLDSSLVAAIAVDALGPDHVHGIIMPGPFSPGGSEADALELAERLGITTTTVPIVESYDLMMRLTEDMLGEKPLDAVSQNIQARLRGLILMTYSNARGALVLNTANKTEAAVGYSTLYGDTVGAFAPISDVYKTDCFELALERNDNPVFIGEPIPPRIITKKPSAELSEGQTDEGSLGLDYPELDAILFLHLEENLGLATIIDEGFDEETVVRVLRMVQAAEYKRRQEPLGPVVSTRHLTRHRGWPVTNGWVDTSTAEGGEGHDPDDLIPNRLLREAIGSLIEREDDAMAFDPTEFFREIPPRPPRPAERDRRPDPGDGFDWGMFFRN